MTYKQDGQPVTHVRVYRGRRYIGSVDMTNLTPSEVMSALLLLQDDGEYDE